MISVLRGVANSRLHRGEFVLDDGLDAGARAQDLEVVGDFHRQLVEFFGDFLAAERGQPRQPQFENGLGLLERQPRGAVFGEPMARIVDQRDHRRHILRRPVARHQGVARGVGIRRGADHADDLVDIGHRDREADQDMGAIAGLVEQEFGAAGDHLLAEGDEHRQEVLQVHHLRPAGIERQHVGGEIGLQRRESIELVQHHFRHGVALEFDDDAKAVAVGFVAQGGDTLDLLLAHQFGDTLDHGGLVHLVGNFRDDDGFAVLAEGLDLHLAAHHDRAAAEMIGRANALASEDDAAGRKIRSRNDIDQFVDRQPGIFDQRHAGVDDFAEIVRRNVGRHADGDAAGAVDQKVGEFCRQNRGSRLGTIVVGLEIDGVLVDIAEHRERAILVRRASVYRIGGRRIAIDRAEIALAVDQRQAHGEILRHPDHRVVNRLVAVRMIFTDHVADDARGLDVFLVGRVPLLVHRIQNAAMHRLQAVARIRQRPRHDHAHGVIEVGALHLIEDGYGANIRGNRRFAGLLIFRFRQREIRSVLAQNHIAYRGLSNHP